MSRFFVLLLLIPLLVAQTANEVEITAEPSHHLALENEFVRVFKVEAAPHASTLMHRHRHDYVFVTLGDSDISNEVAGKSPVELKLSDGETRFAAGNFAHVARNLSSQPFRNITVELLQDEKMRESTGNWPETSGEKTFTGGRTKILFVKDGVRVSETDLDPGATLPSHHHSGPHLVVAVTDLDLRSDAEGVPPAAVKISSGDIRWVAGGVTHTVTNLGTRPARLVLLEF